MKPSERIAEIARTYDVQIPNILHYKDDLWLAHAAILKYLDELDERKEEV